MGERWWTSPAEAAAPRTGGVTVDFCAMGNVTIIDVTDVEAFGRVPPCADPGFDHRSCDYWENSDGGSKAARLSWLKSSESGAGDRQRGGGAGLDGAGTGSVDGAAIPKRPPANPFLADLEAKATPANPFATTRAAGTGPSPLFGLDPDDDTPAVANPFAPPPVERPAVGSGAPRKLQLLGRGLGVAGSYAKILLVDDVAMAYAQFGPLTAYPRAQRTRDLYPSLPDAPLPAVITCIATTAEGRGEGHARALIEAVCDDLTERGFTAVETYPEIGARPDATSAATPEFWLSIGFAMAISDQRFPVMRRDLG